MIEKIGVQLFTVRDYLGDAAQIRDTFKKLKNMGYNCIQTAGVPNVSYEEFGKIAAEEGLEICGTHDDFQLMQNDIEKSIENHRLLNTKIMGIGGNGYDGSDKTWRTIGYHNDEQLFGTIEVINKIADTVYPEGFKFSYHHHGYEFRNFKGKTVLKHIIDGTDSKKVSICLDTYWVQYGGADVRQTIKDLSGRIDILHLKDMGRDEKEPFMACVGEGNMYWKGIIEEALNSGVKYFVVEQDFCQDRDPFECLKKSSNYLHKNFMK